MIIDMHSHFVAPSYLQLAEADPDAAQARVATGPGGARFLHPQNYPLSIGIGPIEASWSDPAAKLRGMDAAGIEVAAISPPTFMFFYWAEPNLALHFSRLQNDGLAATVRAHPDRFVGLATVPLQSPDLAIQEMERAVGDLGLRGLEIGTTVNGRNLDAPELAPFFERVQQLELPVFVHPNACAIEAGRIGKWYFENVIGFMLDTTIAIGSLIFGGVLERFPDLKLYIAHGGGYFPYQLGRFDHVLTVRDESRGVIPKPASEYLKRLYFDSLTHSPQALAYLISLVGADRIVLGSDHPFDMGEFRPVDFIRSVPGLSEADQLAILGETAAMLLKLKSYV